MTANIFKETELRAKKAVFIRLDKIGDLISTLPCDQIRGLESYNITWVIAKGLAFIPEHSVPKRRYFELDKKKPWRSFWSLYKILKTSGNGSGKVDLAISFQAPWWVSLAMFCAGIPSRVGRISQWHSFLFFNRGLRQSRSESFKHEVEYNADLVGRAIDIKSPACPVLKLQNSASTETLKKFDLSAKKYFVIHPGMAGSALNWPVKKYIELIDNLLNENHTVVMTGTAADEAWLSEIKIKFNIRKNFCNLQNRLNSNELLSILENAKSVFAPSTGVLHLAASLGTKSIGVYSPIKVQKSTRWRARGDDVTIFEPAVNCPATQTCFKDKCPEYLCLERVSVGSIKQAMLS